MSILNCDNISLSYGTKEIIKNITFSLNDGEKMGIIGVNGAGKSTLLNIICGKTEPTTGTVSIRKDCTVGMLNQIIDTDFIGKTVYEYAVSAFESLIRTERELEELADRLKDDPSLTDQYTSRLYDFKLKGGAEYKTKTKSFLARFGFRADMYDFPAENLSGGQRTRLALATLLLTDSKLIILDEPTNHLDIETVEWLEDYIRSSSAAFMIVSHDRFFLDRVTTTTLEIENLTATKYQGGYSEFKEKKRKLTEDAAKHYEQQQKEIKRLEAFIENQRKWNRERNIIAAESRQKAIDRMVKFEKPKAPPKSINIVVQSVSGSSDVLSVRHLSKSFDGNSLFSDLSFELKKGDRMLVIGPNGCGKSTLLKIINGQLKADSGVCELGYSQTVGYYDQEIQQLNPANTVIEELLETDPDMTTGDARNRLAQYGFYGDDVFKEVCLLSGGEKARLSICKLVMQSVSFLILDEPTNHLDIPSKEILENALLSYGGTILAVSHDRYFIRSLSTRILEIDKIGFADGYAVFNGGYDAYIARRRKQSAPTVTEAAPESAAKSDYLAAKREKSQKRSEMKRYAFLGKEIERLEKREKEIEVAMLEKSSDYKLLSELSDETARIKETLECYYEEYFALAEEYGE